MNITEEHLEGLLTLVGQANQAVMEVYTSNSAIIEVKADNSPLTQADKASHKIIMEGLTNLFPSIPVLSEEGSEEENIRIRSSSTYWLVDPIDGTQDFVNRTGEFCIAIGLIENDEPVFGFVSAPTFDTIYYGGPSMGSFKKVGDETPTQIHAKVLNPHIVAVSRTHIVEATVTYIEKNYPGAEKKPIGSMLKQMALAEGKVDLYPVIDQPLHLWDVAAGQAIIEGAGGTVTRFNGALLDWRGMKDFKTGDFIAKAGEV